MPTMIGLMRMNLDATETSMLPPTICRSWNTAHSPAKYCQAVKYAKASRLAAGI
jgi:hypothetical protein